MTENEIHILKTKIDNGTVRISFFDGEETIAKILSVSEPEKDIIFDVVSTNRNDKYKGKTGAHLVRFDEVSAVS